MMRRTVFAKLFLRFALASAIALSLAAAGAVQAQQQQQPQQARPQETAKPDPSPPKAVEKPKVEAKPEAKPETKPDPKPETKSEPKPEPKPEAKPEPIDRLPQSWAEALNWRLLGPAAMGGRIVASSVYEADPSTFWVATASGGLLKTTNNGTTFEHQFDRESTVSIGDVCVAPSDKNIVWVGTGEHNPRNSVSYGDGVYKSVDGGKSWKRMGLADSFQIGRVRIHPKDPNIVYVGALGRLYGPNYTRGLYKTTDGGRTWERVLYVDDKTGVIDLQLNPNDPEEILVAMYERRRGIYDENEPVVRYGAGSGIYKSTDGGKSWKRLTKGLPACKLGRIGFDYYRKDPKVIYAIVESEDVGKGTPPPSREGGRAQGSAAYLGVQGASAEDKALLEDVVLDGPAAKAGLKAGDAIVKIDDKDIKSYQDIVSTLRGRKAGDKAKFRALRDGRTVEVVVTLGTRPADPNSGFGGTGGPTSERPYMAMLNGQSENAQDRQGDKGSETGGVYRSDDGGESWTRVNSLNPRPMYFSQVRVDPSDDQNVYVLGIALYRSSNGGKRFQGDGGRGVHADHHALWIDPRDGRHMVLGGDGGVYVTYDRMSNWDHLNTMAIGQFYHVALDARLNYRVYGGLQDNGSWGGPSRVANDRGASNEDWFTVGQGDGFHCAVDPNDPDQVYFTSQNGGMGRRHLVTGEERAIRPVAARGPGNSRFRFNWNTPFLLSAHNSRIFYAAGNYVLKSLNKGDKLTAISPEIARTSQGTATAIAESPLDPNVIYAGTDDGYLWVTKDGGDHWSEISKNVGLAGYRCAATIEASRFAAGRVYVCFDGHRSDDDNPLVFVSEDHGQTFRSISASLPWGSTRCLREDIANPDLLFCGTEFGVWASVTRGRSWTRINNNLPTVAVHEIAIHPTAGEIVAATHGRSLWAVDIAPLRQINEAALHANAQLYEPAPAVRWLSKPNRGGTNRRFVASNPTANAQIYFSLAAPAEKVELKIYDYQNKVIRQLRAPRSAGLHRVLWDLTGSSAPAGARPSAAGPARAAGPAEETPGGAFLRFGAFRRVPAGMYRASLAVDGKEFSQGVKIVHDPEAAPEAIAVSESGRDFDEELRESELEEEREREGENAERGDDAFEAERQERRDRERDL